MPTGYGSSRFQKLKELIIKLLSNYARTFGAEKMELELNLIRNSRAKIM